MNIVYLVGRILFVAIFLYAGVHKILDIPGTADIIAAKVSIPAAIEPLLAKASAVTSMAAPNLLALSAGVIEIVFSLFVIFGIATRFSAAVLFIFVCAAIFYGHPFWELAGDARMAEMDEVIRRLPLLGGLLIILAVGPWLVGLVREETVVVPPRDARL